MFSLLQGFKKLDWGINIAVLILIIAGLLSLAGSAPVLFQKQIVWFILGLILIIIFFQFDWRPFMTYRGAILSVYFLAVLLLLITYFFAPTVRGIKGWLPLGPFQFQVSEIAKFALILFYAHFFSRQHLYIGRVSNIFISFIYFAIPAFLVAIQPDFGSVLVLFAIWFGFLLISGIKWKHLTIALVIFTIIGVIMWYAILENYQKERILGLFLPRYDPLGINYSVIQSKIAIGSAGLLGKGFQQGTQAQLGFLTEAQTDFIFAALVEEWGLLAGLIVIFAFALLIFRIIRIGLNAENNFNRFVCLGTVILFITQFILNIGSNLGLTPVIGVTFPFLSYGGSSILTNLILVGIIQFIHFRRS